MKREPLDYETQIMKSSMQQKEFVVKKQKKQ